MLSPAVLCVSIQIVPRVAYGLLNSQIAHTLLVGSLHLWPFPLGTFFSQPRERPEQALYMASGSLQGHASSLII